MAGQLKIGRKMLNFPNETMRNDDDDDDDHILTLLLFTMGSGHKWAKKGDALHFSNIVFYWVQICVADLATNKIVSHSLALASNSTVVWCGVRCAENSRWLSWRCS